MSYILPQISLALLIIVNSASAQNVIDTDGGNAVASPLQITPAQVETFLSRVLRPGHAEGAEALRVRTKLDTHVQEFLDGWPWMPFHHTLGISGYEAYFNHPDEMFYVLTLALPYLQPATAERVKTFLRGQLNQSPPYGLKGWDNRTGRPRESYAVPPGLRLRKAGEATSAFGVYAFWAWSYYAREDGAAKSHWLAVRERMKPLLETNYRFEVNKKDYTKDEAEKLNGDLAGLLGLARLARLNGDAVTEKAGRQRLSQVLELRLNLERVNPKILEKTTASKSLHVNKLARYCDLVPELGDTLQRLSDGCGAVRLRAFRELRNGWYLAFGDRFIGGENYTNPLHFPRSLFAAATFIEQRPAVELLEYIDVPWCRGDFYFIEKCALALWSASGHNWASLESPDAESRAPAKASGTLLEPPPGRVVHGMGQWEEWDKAEQFLPASGPGGTEWDAPYRSFIQTDESAVSKGFPTHAEAAAQIRADAAKSAANHQKHKGWVLFIKHYSRAYRPESATADLRRLYEQLLALGSQTATTANNLPFEGDPRWIIHRNVVYGISHPESQRLDAYLVKSDQPTPVLIEIHGGGWRRGNKSQFIYPGDLIARILEAGISVVSIDYRLTPEHVFPAPMEDVARAVQFLRLRAKEWNLDPRRMAAMGGSAGAHLSAWIALHDDLAQPDSPDPVQRQSTRLSGFVALSGPMDLTRVRPTELARQPLRGQDFANAFTAAFACAPEQYEGDAAIRRKIREASPLFLVTDDDPPAFLMGGTGEEMQARRHPPAPEVINDPHSAWHGILLADALDKAGVSVTCRIGPQVGKNPELDNAAIVSFLRRLFFGP